MRNLAAQFERGWLRCVLVNGAAENGQALLFVCEQATAQIYGATRKRTAKGRTACNRIPRIISRHLRTGSIIGCFAPRDFIQRVVGVGVDQRLSVFGPHALKVEVVDVALDQAVDLQMNLQAIV